MYRQNFLINGIGDLLDIIGDILVFFSNQDQEQILRSLKQRLSLATFTNPLG